MAKKQIAKYDKKYLQELEKMESTTPVRVDGNFHKMMEEARRYQSIRVNVAAAAEEYACIFGANKNLYRVIPSMQDGLRPGKRRMLWTWWQLMKEPTKYSDVKEKSKKVNDIIGSTTNIHPHGGSAIYETIVNEGQLFRNNVFTIRRQGNYGNINGQPAGADRYIEMYMTEYLIDCFFDEFWDYCVPMKETYNGEGMEPEYLPAKYPHALFNPQFSGIGYGLASNIPPFNVTEVLEATIKLVKNPDAKIMLIPDFKCGCDVIDNGTFKEINKTGEGKVLMQATYSIDAINNVIRITALPYNIYAQPWIQSIVPLCTKGGTLEGKIKDIRNDTTEADVKITLVLSPDANPDEVMDYLLNKTLLRDTKSVKIRMIDDYEDFEYGVKTYLKEWLEFRRDTIRYKYNKKLVQYLTKQQTNEVLLMVFNKDNAETTLKICKNSNNRASTIEELMRVYKISSLQAGTIADMRLYHFNKETYNRFKEEKKELKKNIDEIMGILHHDSKIDELIIQQMEEGIKKYGHPRHSRVIKPNDVEDNTPDTMHVIGISKSGYIKKLKMKKEMTLGVVGKDNRNVTVLEIGNRDSILVISADGTLSQIPMSSIPDMKEDDIGVEIKRYFDGKGDIIAVLKSPTERDLIRMGKLDLLMITKMGFAKRTLYSELVLKNGKAQKIISLNEGDELANVTMVNDPSLDVVICTSLGNGIRLEMEEIKRIAKTGKGTRIISTKVDEDVVDICVINPTIKHLLYITSAGKMKLTELRYFPRMERKQSTIPLITLDTTERLIGVASAKKTDKVQLYGKKGGNVYDPIGVSEIPVRSRISKGERLQKMPRGECILGYKLYRA